MSRVMVPAHRSVRSPTGVGATVALALLLLPALNSAGSTGSVPSAGAPAHLGLVGRAIHPPGLGLGHGIARPDQGGYWYTQEGATLGQLNGTDTIAGVRALTEQFVLVTSPYSIGYELNGLSDTGDWYQIVISDNWPGCASGFEVVSELWDAFGNSGPVNCDPTLTLSAGDSVRLGMNFTASGNGCLDVWDLTRSTSEITCAAQYDAGATTFVTVQATSNGAGYFTGPMTEIVNLTASDCPDYTIMPRLDYQFTGGIFVTGFTPWSDEWELGGSFTYCYSGGGDYRTIARGDPSTQYEDTAQGTAYGPHVVGAMNYSLRNPLFGFRVQTDVLPMSVTLTASPPVVGIGGVVNLSAVPTGGTGPYTGLWYFGGVPQPGTGLNTTFFSSSTGTYSIEGYAIDKLLDVGSAPSPLSVEVVGPLSVGAIVATPGSSSADVGQTVTFTATRNGGIPPFAYAWSGLPGGCAAADAPTISCVAAGTGAFSIQVNVSDSNGSYHLSPALAFWVSASPTASVLATPTAIDLGQSLDLVANVLGGAAPIHFTWNGLPSGCPAIDNATIHCTPLASGNYSPYVQAADASGETSTTSPLSVRVYAALTVSVAENRSLVEVGDAVALTATLHGGSGAYTIAWAGLPSGCAGGNVSSVVCALGVAGTYHVNASIVDSLGGAAAANPLVLTVLPALLVGLTVAPGAVGSGTVVQFTSNVSGGTGPYRYSWSGLPASCYQPLNGSFGCAVFDTGAFQITVHVYDSIGRSKSATAFLNVTAGPSSGPADLGGSSGAWELVAGAAILVGVAAAVVLARRRRGPPEDDGPADDPQA